MRPVSKLLATKCLTIATTCRSWIASTSGTTSAAARYGSSPKASGTRPPVGTRAMSTAGPSRTLCPLPRASSATAPPYSPASAGSNVAASAMAAGNAVTPSAPRTPLPPSV